MTRELNIYRSVVYRFMPLTFVSDFEDENSFEQELNKIVKN